MAQLTMSTLIKIILGLAVVVIVVGAMAVFFGGRIMEFFKSLPGEEEAAAIVLTLLK
jgi:hypothetical protein